jgi:hypothetical protein
MLLMAADIFSFVTVALATAHARITALEAELKASTEALNDANAANLLRGLPSQQKPGLRRLKKHWLMLIRSKPSRSNSWLSDLTKSPSLLAVSVSSYL